MMLNECSNTVSLIGQEQGSGAKHALIRPTPPIGNAVLESERDTTEVKQTSNLIQDTENAINRPGKS